MTKLISDSGQSGKNGAPKISSSQAMRAAKRAGMAIVNIKKLEGSSQLGAYAKQLGVIALGRSYLIFCGERLQKAITQCDETISKVSDPIVELHAQEAQDRRLEQLVEVGSVLIKSANSDGTDGAHAVAPIGSFPIRQPSVPSQAVQVNIGVQATNPPDTNKCHSKPGTILIHPVPSIAAT